MSDRSTKPHAESARMLLMTSPRDVPIPLSTMICDGLGWRLNAGQCCVDQVRKRWAELIDMDHSFVDIKM